MYLIYGRVQLKNYTIKLVTYNQRHNGQYHGLVHISKRISTCFDIPSKNTSKIYKHIKDLHRAMSDGTKRNHRKSVYQWYLKDKWTLFNQISICCITDVSDINLHFLKYIQDFLKSTFSYILLYRKFWVPFPEFRKFPEHLHLCCILKPKHYLDHRSIKILKW